MRFTVADVERFKNLLKYAEPTYYLCMPPPDYQPSSSPDTHYTLYFAETFHDFLNLLTKHHEHMARYVLTASGHLCFGREGEPGKRIPEHWQMLGQETHIIAAGNIFVKNGVITGLNDQSAQPTGLLSLIYTLRALHNHALPLANNMELIQSAPENNSEYSSWITRATLQAIIDDGLLLENAQKPTLNRLGFFYPAQKTRIPTNRGPLQKSEYVDVLESRTTEGVVPTW